MMPADTHALRWGATKVRAVLASMVLPLAAAAAVDAEGTQNGFAPSLRSARTAVPRESASSAVQAPLMEVEMFTGESRSFAAPGVSRIAVGNGSLLTAAALDEREVLVFANAPGVSSLFIWYADGRQERMKISIVPGDIERHAREIAAFLGSIPKARATVVGAHIMLEGDELSDADLHKVELLTKRYPQIVNFTNRVGREQMVLMEVQVVEFPRSAMHEFGLKWFTGGTGTQLPAVIDKAVHVDLMAQLNALAQEGRATVLSAPRLSARNGARASFLAGGEVPYTVSTRDGVMVQFRPYGVRLDITPSVDRQGWIRATVQSEVSSVDRSVSTVNGPGLLSRRTETEFNVRSGQTLVLSGLLQREQSRDVDKLPVLGDVPLLGALFRSTRTQDKETELVVLVTPTVVDAARQPDQDLLLRTQQRLTERLGPSPHLSDPLLPTPSSASVREPAAPRSEPRWLRLPDGAVLRLGDNPP